jgi:hypothetical protein
MNIIVKNVIVGAFSGLLSAIMVDLNAWKLSPNPDFDFKLAAKRWLAGAVSGAAAALGFGAAVQ